MNILYINNDMSISGSPKAILTELKLLKQLGHNTFVISSGGPLVSELEKEGISHFHVDLPLLGDIGIPTENKLPWDIKWRYLKASIKKNRLISSVYNIKKIIKKNDIDIIQLHQPGPTFAGAIAAILTGTPYIIRIQHILKNEFPPLFHSTIVRKAKGISVITPEIYNHLQEVFEIDPQFIRIIPTAVNLGGREPFKEKRNMLKILSVTTFGDVKYQAVIKLIKAVNLLLEKGIDCELNIIGDGPKKELILETISKMNPSYREKVKLLGAISNIEDYYINTDIVVGVGRVAMEALYFGKPLLCCSHFSYGGIFTKDNSEKIYSYNFSGRNFGKDSLKEECIFNDLLKLSLANNHTFELMYKYNTDFFDKRFNSNKLSLRTEELFNSARYTPKGKI